MVTNRSLCSSIYMFKEYLDLCPNKLTSLHQVESAVSLEHGLKKVDTDCMAILGHFKQRYTKSEPDGTLSDSVFANSQTLVKSLRPFIIKTTHVQHPNQIQFDSSPAC